jgi:hypothetical protein
VYAYGVIGGRGPAAEAGLGRRAYVVHRARRDTLTTAIRALGAEPAVAEPGYALPVDVASATAAQRVGQQVEDRCSVLYAALVAAAPGSGRTREQAVTALGDAAVRLLAGAASPVALPGCSCRGPAPSVPGSLRYGPHGRSPPACAKALSRPSSSSECHRAARLGNEPLPVLVEHRHVQFERERGDAETRGSRRLVAVASRPPRRSVQPPDQRPQRLVAQLPTWSLTVPVESSRARSQSPSTAALTNSWATS